MTFRAWRSRRATPGKRYRCGAIGFIRVDSIDQVALGDITESEVRASGFGTVADLAGLLQNTASRKLTPQSMIYRVRFHYDGPGQPHSEPDTSAESLDELLVRLERMDRRSRRGPWTANYLELIAAQPGVAASRLAPRIGRDKPAFKADLRKLKALGLTRSLEVGYELSRVGKAILRRMG
jgi:predicted transcriptional regulator